MIYSEWNPAAGVLSNGFQFSQSCLQDYSECRRRFQLRYLLEFAWPAVESEPALEQERLIQRGTQFHKLVHQHLIGVPDQRLSSGIHDDELKGWWTNFLDFTSQSNFDICPVLRPEISMSASLGAHRLVAKFDLIASHKDGQFTIYDWKTSQRRPERKFFADRLQTRLYPYLFVRAGAFLNGGEPVEPHQVELVYWFAAYPDQPLHFPYSTVQFERDQAFIHGMIMEIASLAVGDYHLTAQQNRCVFCVYRSLCNRGEQAGSSAEAAGYQSEGESIDVMIDFDQIAEIEF
jgi:hypothetical protein